MLVARPSEAFWVCPRRRPKATVTCIANQRQPESDSAEVMAGRNHRLPITRGHCIASYPGAMSDRLVLS